MVKLLILIPLRKTCCKTKILRNLLQS